MVIDDIFKKEPDAANHDLLQRLSTKPIVVFGSGNLGKKIGAFLLLKGYKLVAYSDNDPLKWGTNINAVPILSPVQCAELYVTDALFVISIWGPPQHSFIRTKNQLTEIGIKDIIHAAAIMQLFPTDLLPHYHCQTRDYYFNHKNELIAVYDLLADEESKKQFLAHIDYRVNLNFDDLPLPDSENQYFPTDIIKLSENETFIDGGAYDGDTLKDFCTRTKFRFNKYIALEPDPKNREKLEEKVKSLSVNGVSVFPYAVGNTNCFLKFTADGSVGAGISTHGNIDVECVRLDDKFYELTPTFLKFDIEGAELDALIGAEKIITDLQPIIAVCIYHKPEDLWEIPLKILEYYKQYKIFVRSHAYDGFEFVLYAIRG